MQIEDAALVRAVELHIERAFAVHLREEHRAKRDAVPFQDRLYALARKVQRIEPALLHPALQHQKMLERAGLFFQLQIAPRRRKERILLQNADAAVRFEDRIGDLADVEHVLAAQTVHQIAHRIVRAAHHVLFEDAVADQYLRRAAKEAPDRGGFQRELRQHALHQIQREDRHDAVQQGNVRIGDRGARKIGNDERHQKVVGLQVAHLPLARQSQDQKHEQIEKNSA